MKTLQKILCFILLSSCTLVVHADVLQTENIEQHINLLVKQQSLLTKQLEQTNTDYQSDVDKSPATSAALLKKQDDLAIKRQLNALLLKRLRQTLNTAQLYANDLASRQAYLQNLDNKMPLTVDERHQRSIEKVDKLISHNQRQIQVIKDTVSLAEQLQTLQAKFTRLLAADHGRLQKRVELNKLRQTINDEQSEINRWLDESNQLEQKIQDEGASYAINDRSQLLALSQRIKLNEIKIGVIKLEMSLSFIEHANYTTENSKQLKASLDKLNASENKSKILHKDLDEQQEFIQSQEKALKGFLAQDLITKQNLQKYQKNARSMQSLHQQLTAQLKRLDKIIDSKQLEYNDRVKQLIAKRQGVPGVSLDSWSLLGEKLLQLPLQFFHYIHALSLRLLEGIMGIDNLLRSGLLFVGLLLLCVWYWGRQLFNRSIVKEQAKRKRMSANMLYILLQLLRRNWGFFCSLLFFIFTCQLVELSFQAYELAFYLGLVWLVFRILLGMARLSLLDRVSDVSGQDVTLYYRLRWTFTIGGLITALTVISHHLALSYIVQDLFTRLFMIFLLAVSLVLLKGKDVVPSLLRPFIKPKRAYLRRVIRLLSLFIPLIIFIDAVIGLMGYLNLAWMMSYFQILLVMIFTAYVLCRGLLVDLLDVSSEWMIKNMRNGWLWSEAILKPIDRIVRIALLLMIPISFSLIVGWGKDSIVADKLNDLLSYHLFSFSGGNITIRSSIEFAVLLVILVWISKWTREFCYRWLYREVKDAGIRNSLSVFTQYTVITIGAYITLRVLGLDFSGMSMILGGLAVGMGFGLRDFASNIVGGLMLLIERPVREGDLISVDNFEGKVTHIGIRAMRVRSWDHMEVMIPNSVTFNNTFTNWTHQDSVVRTVIPIKVHRKDDPELVRNLIIDVIDLIPEVLGSPEPQVFLREIDDALIVFHLRYFINIGQHSRVATRSKVLFAITAQFKAAGLREPYPQQDLHLDRSAVPPALEKV